MENQNTFLKFVVNYSDEEILKIIDDPPDIDPGVYHAALVIARDRELISEEEFGEFSQSSATPENLENLPVTEEERKLFWKCPECHEVVDIEYDICWNCQKEKPVNIELPSTEEIIEERVKISSFNPVKSGLLLVLTGIVAFLLEYFVFSYRIHLHRLIMAVILAIVGIGFIVFGLIQKTSVKPGKG